MKQINIVRIGEYVGAVKPGRCPMYSYTQKENLRDMVNGLREDFPDYQIVQGGKNDRASLAKFIIRDKRLR